MTRLKHAGPSRRRQEFTAQIKAVGDGTGDLAAGEFEAVVAVFGNVDSYGDVIVKGAFAEDLETWDHMPVVWSHDWGNVWSIMGEVKAARETDKGLWVRAALDVEDNPDARQVHRQMKAGRIKQFSFAYDVLDGAEAERDGRPVYELRKLKTYEVGPCLVGVNQETELLAVKAHDVATAMTDGGLVLSERSMKALETAWAELGAVVLAKGGRATGSDGQQDGQGTPSSRSDDDPQSSGKSDGTTGPASRRAIAAVQTMDL